jgi:hypothetical protein
MLWLVAGVGVLLAVGREYVLPWWSDRAGMEALVGVDGQVFTEARGQYLFRQFAGDRLSQRAIYVHLSDPRVDDATLAVVATLPYTEVLTIRSAKVTDEGLRALERLPHLAELVLVDTQVTEEGLARLRKALPGLRRVEWRTSEKILATD